MTVQEAYNSWSAIYDSNKNKTRDLEGVALRGIFADKTFENCLEIGCGTGKNTVWLLERTQKHVAVDFSADMLAKAKEKIVSDKVTFVQADIREPWQFDDSSFDLVTCSLVLEHIADLNAIFKQAHRVLKQNGQIYIGELHPFKQYLGTKARFVTEGETFELECFTHPVSEFWQAATDNGFECIYLNEWYDDEDKTEVPRILTLVFNCAYVC